MNYQYWGTSELIEKLQNSDNFAMEVSEYFQSLSVLNEEQEYLLEKARKLSGDKIRL